MAARLQKQVKFSAASKIQLHYPEQQMTLQPTTKKCQKDVWAILVYIWAHGKAPQPRNDVVPTANLISVPAFLLKWFRSWSKVLLADMFTIDEKLINTI